MLIYHCLLSSLILSSLTAQTSQISLRTLQLGGGEMPEAWVQVVGSNKPVELIWSTIQPTKPLAVVHDGTLKLLRKTENAKRENILEIMESLQLPATASEALLLAWNSNEGARYRIIEDQFLKANFNDWIAINTSPNSVALLIGDTKKPWRIPPGKSLIFTPDIQEGKGTKILAASKRADDKVRTFLSSYWPVFSKQRTMIILYDTGDRMRARRIGDYFLRPEEKDG